MCELTKFTSTSEVLQYITGMRGKDDMDLIGHDNLVFTTSQAYAQPRKSIFIPAMLQNSKDSLSAKDKEYEKRNIVKNLVYLYLSVLLISSPMYALINSASSLLDGDGIGSISLAVLGTMQVVAAAALGSYTTKVWGTKLIITVSCILIILYTLSFFYPIIVLALIGAALMGIAYTLIITAAFLYGNILGRWYACVVECDLDTVLVLMLGAINSAFGGGIFLGNILFLYILYPADTSNAIVNVTEDSLKTCAINYCNEDLSDMTTMQPPEPWRYYTLMGVFTAMGVLGTLLSLLVKDFSAKLGVSRRKKRDFWSIVIEPWTLLKDPRGYLLIVITIFIGVEEAFLFSEFTQAFVSCVMGIQQVGMVMLILGFSQFVVSALAWIAERYFGRIAVLLSTIVLFMCCFVTLLIWQPRPDEALIFYTISILWGIADAVLLSIVLAVYGILFDDNIEGSFALGNFWFSLGYLLSFGWSPFLCVNIKICIMITFAVVGTICYVFLEVLNRKTGSLNLSSIIGANLTMELPIACLSTSKELVLPKLQRTSHDEMKNIVRENSYSTLKNGKKIKP